MSVNFRLKAIYAIGRRKAFYRQRIPESTCPRKEIGDIDVLVTSRNGGIEIMQSIRKTSRPPARERKWNKLSEFRWTSAKVIPQEKTYAGYISTMSQRFKSSREVRSEGLKVLDIRFCSLSYNFKLKIGAPSQTWQHYSMHGRMVDL